jgi:hypothetical protein
MEWLAIWIGLLIASPFSLRAGVDQTGARSGATVRQVRQAKRQTRKSWLEPSFFVAANRFPVLFKPSEAGVECPIGQHLFGPPGTVALTCAPSGREVDERGAPKDPSFAIFLDQEGQLFHLSAFTSNAVKTEEKRCLKDTERALVDNLSDLSFAGEDRGTVSGNVIVHRRFFRRDVAGTPVIVKVVWVSQQGGSCAVNLCIAGQKDNFNKVCEIPANASFGKGAKR